MDGLKNVVRRQSDALSRVAWDRLEALLADHYRTQGYHVEHVGTGATGGRFDGGIDLKLRKDDAYIVVQCKHWNAKQVPHNDVHQLLGIMINEGATGAILATSGEFTRAARDAAARLGHVQLIDGHQLRAMLGPLPEPELASRLAGAAAPLASKIGERLLSAAEDRIRGGRGDMLHRSAAQTLGAWMLGKLLLFLLFVAVVAVSMTLALKLVNRQLQRPTATTAVRTAPLPAPTISEGESVVELPDAGARVSAEAESYRPPTDAEIRESQRKADEAMKVIEESTPEM